VRITPGGVRRAVLRGGFVCLIPVAGAVAQGTVGTLTVGTAPSLLRVSTAVAGLEPNPVSGTSTYTIRAAKANKPQKVTAQLNAAMPAGVTLTIELTAPTGATSNGPVALDATIRDLVGNITNTTAEVGTITYTLTATTAAGVLAAQSRTVTLTVTAWP
jgi:hypothetical protein